MKLKSLSYYYSNKLKGCLRDGDNKYIKDYTTYGFKKSYQMWNDYSHESIEKFFDDFMKDYSEEFLRENCNRCHEKMRQNGSVIDYNDLFDVLIRRLVTDAYIGFKSEDIIREKLVSEGCSIENRKIISKYGEKELDTKYGIDILVFKGDNVSSFIQVKNTSTFSNDGFYIREKRKEFFDKEENANKYINDGKLRPICFYIYDKGAYIRDGKFKYFINPKTNKCHFLLDELINKDGSLKINVKYLKSREL